MGASSEFARSGPGACGRLNWFSMCVSRLVRVDAALDADTTAVGPGCAQKIIWCTWVGNI